MHSLVEIGHGPVFLEKMMKKCEVYENNDNNHDDGKRTHFDQKSSRVFGSGVVINTQ